MDAKALHPGIAGFISRWRSLLPGKSSSDDMPGLTESPELQPHWDDEWSKDLLLDGFDIRTFRMLDRPHLPEEPEGNLVATLVRQHEPRHQRAVLYIHGWNEYFFQRHLAEFFDGLGYDFYAIDLHRYGRSLQEGELPGYMEAVEEYYEELDACLDLIQADHKLVLLCGHSTGGLVASLYANDRPKTFAGVILNSPWIDMQGSALFRALTPPLVKSLSVASPTMALSLNSENDLYGKTLHKDYYGEWDFDLSLKKIESQPIRPGWVRAVVNGHDRIAAGLHIDCPVFIGTSARSSSVKQWCDEAASSDLALNVERLAARSYKLGWHVTLVRFVGAVHDISLSKKPVRDRFFDEIRRWEVAYVRGETSQEKFREAQV